MTQQIDYCCPNITCYAFGKPFPMECWEEGECIGGFPEYDAVGEPILDDYWECGNCPAHTVPMTEFTEALEGLLRPSQSHTKES